MSTSWYRCRAIFRVVSPAAFTYDFVKPPAPEGNVVPLSAHRLTWAPSKIASLNKDKGSDTCYQFSTCQLISRRWNDNSLSDLLGLHDLKPGTRQYDICACHPEQRNVVTLWVWSIVCLFAKTTLPVCVFLGEILWALFSVVHYFLTSDTQELLVLYRRLLPLLLLLLLHRGGGGFLKW